MEIIEVLLLIVIATEGALILAKPEKEKEEVEKATRRDVYGVYKNPLGDTYRKNTRQQYVPIKPGSKMLDGDEEDGI